MGFIAWLPKGIEGLRQLVLALPVLLQIGREIIKALHEIEDYRKRRARAGELAEAMREARKDKDTSKLDAIFRGSGDQSENEQIESKDAKSA